MVLSFNAARFLLHTNPHILGQCRKLGLTNALYMPYPMDENHYCPKEGQARKQWEESYGKGIYVFVACRVDKSVKGQDELFFHTLVNVAKKRPQVRFIFLGWGNSIDDLRSWIQASEMQSQFVVLPPVGKKRMIDYYRSCDIVLDQLVYGYHGATGLEAASIGKPIVIRLRTEHLDPWYKGDYMPAHNVASQEDLYNVLLALIDHPDLREQSGHQLREWLVRNHSEAKTVPILLALLRLTADRVQLPPDFISPLLDEETES